MRAGERALAAQFPGPHVKRRTKQLPTMPVSKGASPSQPHANLGPIKANDRIANPSTTGRTRSIVSSLRLTGRLLSNGVDRFNHGQSGVGRDAARPQLDRVKADGALRHAGSLGYRARAPEVFVAALAARPAPCRASAPAAMLPLAKEAVLPNIEPEPLYVGRSGSQDRSIRGLSLNPSRSARPEADGRATDVAG